MVSNNEINLDELTYINSVYATGDAVAVLVDRPLSDAEFDEIYDSLYDEGIEDTAKIEIERITLVEHGDYANERLKFILSKGKQIYSAT